MAERTPSFEALSPRFQGFDAYFATEIAPDAPALAPRASEKRRLSWRLRALLAVAVVYLATAPFVMIFMPEGAAQFRPWIIVSYFIVLPGVLFGLLSPADAETQLAVAADVWGAARRRIAAFFGFEHAPPPEAEALRKFVELCPAPPAASAFVAHERIVGRIKAGPAAGVVVELVEGVIGDKPAAIAALRFGGPAYGVGALLDDRIDDVDRRGLESLRCDLPPGWRHLTAYADGTTVSERLTAAETLSAFAEIREATAAEAVNLALVDDSAKMYLALTAPVFVTGEATPNAMSVSHALHDYDALVRMAEALRPMFTH